MLPAIKSKSSRSASWSGLRPVTATLQSLLDRTPIDSFGRSPDTRHEFLISLNCCQCARCYQATAPRVFFCLLKKPHHRLFLSYRSIDLNVLFWCPVSFSTDRNGANPRAASWPRNSGSVTPGRVILARGKHVPRTGDRCICRRCPSRVSVLPSWFDLHNCRESTELHP